MLLAHWDMEATYFLKAASLSEQWEHQLRAESQAPLTVFCGGSEVRTCINPKLFRERFGLRVVNAGQHAGFGLVCNVLSALPRLQKGDTFVVSPVTPTENCDELPVMGLRYLLRREGIGAISSPLFPLSAGNLLRSVRFNQQTDWTYLRKLRQGNMAHLYDSQAILHRPDGWMEVTLRKDIASSAPKTYTAKGEFTSVLHFLQRLKAYCDERSVKLICFLPWRYCGSEAVCRCRRTENLRFALLLSESGIPVLKDARLGCVTDESLFADTPLHQNPKGVETYTEVLGRALSSGECWQTSEMKAMLKESAEKESAH